VPFMVQSDGVKDQLVALVEAIESTKFPELMAQNWEVVVRTATPVVPAAGQDGEAPAAKAVPEPPATTTEVPAGEKAKGGPAGNKIVEPPEKKPKK
jgi:hypothetical protein